MRLVDNSDLCVKNIFLFLFTSLQNFSHLLLNYYNTLQFNRDVISVFSGGGNIFTDFLGGVGKI